MKQGSALNLANPIYISYLKKVLSRWSYCCCFFIRFFTNLFL